MPTRKPIPVGRVEKGSNDVLGIDEGELLRELVRLSKDFYQRDRNPHEAARLGVEALQERVSGKILQMKKDAMQRIVR